MQSSPAPQSHDAPRVYGFDLNTSWQPDKDHYDNQKINGLTFPRSIRPSAFTQKLDIEGCDPLSLPVAALLYQQANNHWLRRLAHGTELYLIPTADIAAVVFMTELLQQLKARGVDLDRVSNYRARQDGKVLDKTMNTKYAAQQIAEIIQGWLPVRATDPESQQEITQLRHQAAQLRQQIAAPDASPNTSTPGPTSPIARALHGQSSQSPSTNNPNPMFDPCCLLTVPSTTNQWLLDHRPDTLAVRAFNKWLRDLPISEPKRSVLTTNMEKMEKWWDKQPADAIHQIERVAVMMGIPVNLLGKNYEVLNLLRVMTAAITLTN